MQPDQIATFLDLAETRSFHRTADRLGVTQSTVSARIKALEAALGVMLFNRNRAGADLTTEGLRFEPHARALRAEWAAAMRAAGGAGTAALVVRVGMQHDLVGGRLAEWVARFRAELPDAALYVELDYSAQMCADLMTGALDFAVMFSPRAHPDLHFVTLGDMRFRMVSTHAARVAEVEPGRYIFGNYAPAFAAAHRAALPHLHEAPVTVGQAAAVAGLVAGLGGSAYVAQEAADAMVAAGKVQLVADAPVLTQPVHAGMALRQRTARLQGRLLGIVRHQFGTRR
ncbi:MAG: LysR family transcriptional regulator [Gemmobacter sp.]|uniref:LysR family transcriptional regulator n=1 Tax=Gemmobacter sp. TaxID=1898957 RepID=UPI00391C6313